MWFALARKACKNYGTYFPTSLWCLRQEAGEATGRKHFHFLFGGLPRKAITEATCFALMAQWEKLGGGMARVRVFNRALNGVGYVTKCLGASVGADVYEMNKFGLETCELKLSKGASGQLLRGIREDRRRIERTDKMSEGERESKARKGMTTVCVPRSDKTLPRGELSSSAYKINQGNRELFYDLVEASGKKTALLDLLSSP